MDILDAGGYTQYEEGESSDETDEGADHAADVWETSTGVHHAPHLCARPPVTVEQLRETTRSIAIAHVISTSRTNRFPVNCPARRTHRHFVKKNEVVILP